MTLDEKIMDLEKRTHQLEIENKKNARRIRVLERICDDLYPPSLKDPEKAIRTRVARVIRKITTKLRGGDDVRTTPPGE